MALREVIISSTLPQFRDWFIIGATSVEQLAENLGALKVKLITKDMDVLNDMTAWKREG